MDTTVLDVMTLEAIVHNIAATTHIKCSHDGCGSFVGYDEVHDHELACSYGPCTCPEPSCDFTGPPVVLVVHLAADYLIQVHKFSYGKTKQFQEQVPVPGSPCRRLIGEGQDGAIFFVTISALGPTTIVSSVCVRSASCVWPLYMVRMWAHGPPSSSDIMKVKAEASSSVSPGTVESEELMSFLEVPSRNLVGARPSKQLHFCICIDKNNRS